jgi:hypothetical protein
VDTFARYVWQAKQAVRQWLTCLAHTGGPHFIVCEHIEDVLVVYPDRLRFLQLKTRDRGSWSAANMCDHGIDSLARSYTVARNAGLHDRACFELWLEGPIGATRDTASFVGHPADASGPIRDKIVTKGIQRRWLDDFLDRLVIHSDQPARAHIDAKAIREMGALWPSLSMPGLEQVYQRLLDAAMAAQRAEPAPAVLTHVRAAQSALRPARAPELSSTAANEDALAAISAQILSKEALLALTPPLPGESVEDLLARMSAGSTASMLELKMMQAGASRHTIERAQVLRAEADVRRQLLLAGSAGAEIDLEALAERVLMVAEATADGVALSAAANPVAAARSAEVIAAHLLSQPDILGRLDRAGLFDGDGLTMYGFLSHLSDLCRFNWRAA